MTNIIHLSDLHFGTENKHAVDVLIAAVNKLNPDVVIISGDFTQRARVQQFEHAKKFIQSLTCQQVLCVPGNHDIPLHNLLIRFFRPFAKYKKYIAENLNPTYFDNNVAIFGINSAIPYKLMDGYVTSAQLHMVRDFFCDVKPNVARIVFMHHNMIKPEYHKVLINFDEIIKTFSECRIDLILSGHLHDACMEKIERDFITYNMYAITAGTALSYRYRTQPNSFNLVSVLQDQYTITAFELTNDGYLAVDGTNSYTIKR